jgi:hypothetical protein
MYPVLVLLLSHQRMKRTTTKESGDSFVNVYLGLQLTCHLLSAFCYCRLYLCRSQEWALHSPSSIGFVCLEFSWLHAPLVFSSMQPYPPVTIVVLFLLFRVHAGRCPSPTLWWSTLCFNRFYKTSPLQAHWGKCCRSCFLGPVCVFTYHVKECLFSTLH